MGGGASVLTNTISNIQGANVRLPDGIVNLTSRIPEQYVPTVLTPILKPALHDGGSSSDEDELAQSYLMTAGETMELNIIQEGDSESSATGFLDLDNDEQFMVEDDDVLEDIRAAASLQAIARAQIVRATTRLGGSSQIVTYGNTIKGTDDELSYGGSQHRLTHQTSSLRSFGINDIDSDDQRVIPELSIEIEQSIENSRARGITMMVSSQQEKYIREHSMAGGAGDM